MSRRKKFCLSFCLTFVIVLSIDSSAFCQDKIIRTNKDTVLAKIIEMTGDKIKFRRHGMKTGPILEIYKNQISKIIYENNFWTIEGDSLKFKNIEKFEIKLARYAQNIELIFIKSRSKLLTFQYKIGDIIWN